MKKQVKRAVAAVVAAVMLLSAISVTAFAGQPSDPEIAGKEAAPHDHVPVVDKNGEPKLTEDAAAYVQPTCVKPGCREFYQRCAVCGREIPGTRTRKEIPADENLHQPGPVAIEDVKQPTCVAAGSYSEVIHCKVCGKELSRTLVDVGQTTNHVPDTPVKENKVDATCVKEGHYDSVIYCKICGLELARTWKGIPKNDYHISEYSLKRTLSRDENPSRTRVTFADVAFGPLVKQGVLPEAHDGVTLEANCCLNGKTNQRTCADGEEHCAVCGELLNSAIPHTWEGGTVVVKPTANTQGVIEYKCLVCGALYRTSCTTLRVIVTLLNKISNTDYDIRDLDGDNIITPKEAREVLRYSVGYVSPYINASNYRIVDCDMDGKIMPNDARLYLRAAVGLPTA